MASFMQKVFQLSYENNLANFNKKIPELENYGTYRFQESRHNQYLKNKLTFELSAFIFSNALLYARKTDKFFQAEYEEICLKTKTYDIVENYVVLADQLSKIENIQEFVLEVFSIYDLFDEYPYGSSFEALYLHDYRSDYFAVDGIKKVLKDIEEIVNCYFPTYPKDTKFLMRKALKLAKMYLKSNHIKRFD